MAHLACFADGLRSHPPIAYSPTVFAIPALTREEQAGLIGELVTASLAATAVVTRVCDPNHVNNLVEMDRLKSILFHPHNSKFLNRARIQVGIQFLSPAVLIGMPIPPYQMGKGVAVLPQE